MIAKIENTNLKFENALIARAGNCVENIIYMYNEFFHFHPVHNAIYDFNIDERTERIGVGKKLLNELLEDGYILYHISYRNSNKHDDCCTADNNDCIDDTNLRIAEFFVAGENVIIHYENGGVDISTHESASKIKEVADKHISKYIKDNYDVKCHMIAYSDYLYLNEFEIKLDGPLNYELYNEGFEDIHKDILNSLKNDRNGLYILHGKPGTGKTTYIRHLIKEYSKKYGYDKKFVYIPASLVDQLTSPRFMSFLMENKNSVFILEDCENLVVESVDGKRTSVISDMLNMTDGILSDALQMKFIVTFNTEEKNIDKALLREGRCRMKYEFDLLKKDRANKIAEKNNLNSVSEDISLAELFNGKNKFKNDTKKKIGFNV